MEHFFQRVCTYRVTASRLSVRKHDISINDSRLFRICNFEPRKRLLSPDYQCLLLKICICLDSGQFDRMDKCRECVYNNDIVRTLMDSVRGLSVQIRYIRFVRRKYISNEI